MARRSFHQETVHENFDLDVNKLLGCTIFNEGTKDITVFRKTISPGKYYTIPSDGIPFNNDFIIPIKVTGTNPQENKVYITYTSLELASC